MRQHFQMFHKKMMVYNVVYITNVTVIYKCNKMFLILTHFQSFLLFHFSC